MSLLAADGYEAVFGTPEGDTYRFPLVCWREADDQMYGVVLVKGHLRRVDQLQNFLRYADRHRAVQDDSSSPLPFTARGGVPETDRTRTLR